MDTRGSLRYVIMRTSGPAGSARGQRPPRASRAQATRGILVPALVLASIGTAGAGLAGHAAHDPARAAAAQRPGQETVAARVASSVRTCRTGRASDRSISRINPNTVWMYAITARSVRPVISPDTVWMYGIRAGVSSAAAGVGAGTRCAHHVGTGSARA